MDTRPKTLREYMEDVAFYKKLIGQNDRIKEEIDRIRSTMGETIGSFFSTTTNTDKTKWKEIEGLRSTMTDTAYWQRQLETLKSSYPRLTEESRKYVSPTEIKRNITETPTPIEGRNSSSNSSAPSAPPYVDPTPASYPSSSSAPSAPLYSGPETVTATPYRVPAYVAPTNSEIDTAVANLSRYKDAKSLNQLLLVASKMPLDKDGQRQIIRVQHRVMDSITIPDLIKYVSALSANKRNEIIDAKIPSKSPGYEEIINHLKSIRAIENGGSGNSSTSNSSSAPSATATSYPSRLGFTATPVLVSTTPAEESNTVGNNLTGNVIGNDTDNEIDNATGTNADSNNNTITGNSKWGPHLLKILDYKQRLESEYNISTFFLLLEALEFLIMAQSAGNKFDERTHILIDKETYELTAMIRGFHLTEVDMNDLIKLLRNFGESNDRYELTRSLLKSLESRPSGGNNSSASATTVTPMGATTVAPVDVPTGALAGVPTVARAAVPVVAPSRRCAGGFCTISGGRRRTQKTRKSKKAKKSRKVRKGKTAKKAKKAKKGSRRRV